MRSKRRHSLAAAVATVLLAGARAWAGGGAPEQQGAPAKEQQEFRVPQTPDEHFARAAIYREKAASYRQEAEAHRKMFADHERTQGNPALQSKAGRELPWIAKMRKHCESHIKEAEREAAEADRFAEFHRMRAEEMQGK